MIFFKKLLTLGCTVGALITAGSSLQAEDSKAPKAFAPYSQAVHAGKFVYVSGQVSIDPQTNKIVGKTIEEQVKQTLNNLEAVLEKEGLSLKDVVKVEVFLTDIKDYETMNRLYAQKFYQENKPARVTVEVSGLPKDALVLISCIAYTP